MKPILKGTSPIITRLNSTIANAIANPENTDVRLSFIVNIDHCLYCKMVFQDNQLAYTIYKVKKEDYDFKLKIQGSWRSSIIRSLSAAEKKAQEVPFHTIDFFIRK